MNAVSANLSKQKYVTNQPGVMVRCNPSARERERGWGWREACLSLSVLGAYSLVPAAPQLLGLHRTSLHTGLRQGTAGEYSSEREPSVVPGPLIAASVLGHRHGAHGEASCQCTGGRHQW